MLVVHINFVSYRNWGATETRDSSLSSYFIDSSQKLRRMSNFRLRNYLMGFKSEMGGLNATDVPA